MINDTPQAVAPIPSDQKENSLIYRDHPFIKICIAAMDAEYTRRSMALLIAGTGEDAYRQLTTWLVDNYFNFKASSYFTMENLGNITNFVFSHDVIRDFVLNLTERACTSIGTIQGHDEKNTSAMESFIKGFIEAVADNHLSTSNESTMAPPPVAASIHIERNVLELAIRNNRWVLILFVVFMYIEQSEMFDQILSDLTSHVKKKEKK